MVDRQNNRSVPDESKRRSTQWPIPDRDPHTSPFPTTEPQTQTHQTLITPGTETGGTSASSNEIGSGILSTAFRINSFTEIAHLIFADQTNLGVRRPESSLFKTLDSTSAIAAVAFRTC